MQFIDTVGGNIPTTQDLATTYLSEGLSRHCFGFVHLNIHYLLSL